MSNEKYDKGLAIRTQVLRYAGYGELLHQVGAQQPALSL